MIIQPPARLIAFCGPKTSGKDTAAEYLLRQNSIFNYNLFTLVNFADPLKVACMHIFGLTHAQVYDPKYKEIVDPRWGKTPREILQNVAKLFRTMYAEDIWVRAWERRIFGLPTECIVCTDLRHVEELLKIQELGGKIIYVSNPRVEAERRVGRANNDPLWSDVSEAYTDTLRNHADMIIQNDGVNLTALHTQVALAMQELYGDPAYWDRPTHKSISPIRDVM